MTEKEMFINTWEREFRTTVNVLKAYPDSGLDLRPAEKSKTARELAWVLAGGDAFIDQVVRGQIQPGMPPAPATMKEIVETYQKVHHDTVNKVKGMTESDFASAIKFFTGPKQMGDVPRNQILWFMLMDHIHHRGQFSVYVRMAGGKLPSIYGPTADEPWM